ncbi:4'-phosphopantetheinyl transferase family protein [Streptomyces sp. NPDC004596]|uniref:4'-phosphopantetheinyl transferase family protein n=1 Tax=Streptomyces sp. DSM 118148 TaxID=3448667 RepID=UPI00403FEA7F
MADDVVTGGVRDGVLVEVWVGGLGTPVGQQQSAAEKRELREAARGWVRGVVARRLGLSVAQVRWERGRSGKPRLADDPGLEVSYSHSGGAVALALSTGAPVGVDVERVVVRPHGEGLAEEYLAPGELGEWRRAGGTEAAAGVFTGLWARKEAVLKAWGRGFPGSLADVVTTSGPGGRVAVLSVPAALGPVALWTVHDLPAPPGFRAAVACRAPGARLRVTEVGGESVAEPSGR